MGCRRGHGRRDRTGTRARLTLRGHRGQRGSVIVETAVIMPLILLITMGVVEYSRMFNAASTADAAARSGGRVASTLSRQDDFAGRAALAVSTAVGELPDDVPQELLVYEAGSDGKPIGGSFAGCSTNCLHYTWNETTDSFDFSSGAWDAASHNVCAGADDSAWTRVGVYVKIRMEFLTGLFGGPLTIDEYSVFRLEPVPSSVC